MGSWRLRARPRMWWLSVSDAFGQVMQSPEVKSRMVSQGADPAFLGADDFAKFLASEMPRWADAVKKSGAKLD